MYDSHRFTADEAFEYAATQCELADPDYFGLRMAALETVNAAPTAPLALAYYRGQNALARS
ncbi:MAG: hypothetical protein ABW217_03935 [Polyangiaceae bacterium]